MRKGEDFTKTDLLLLFIMLCKNIDKLILVYLYFGEIIVRLINLYWTIRKRLSFIRIILDNMYLNVINILTNRLTTIKIANKFNNSTQIVYRTSHYLII